MKNKTLKTLVIDRKTWGTGENTASCLLHDDGTHCCLGFLMRQIGFSKDQIINERMPSDIIPTNCSIPNKLIPFINPKTRYDNKIIKNLATINDSTSKDFKNPVRREKRISELFAKLGIKVIYKNNYPKN